MSAVNVAAVRTLPRAAEAIGLAVGPTGAVPRQLGLNRAAHEAHGFTGKVGSTLVLPNGGGATLVAVGVGDKPTPATLREAAAAFTRAVGRRAHIATNLGASGGVDATTAARAVKRLAGVLASSRAKFAASALTTPWVIPRVAARSSDWPTTSDTLSSLLADDLSDFWPTYR